MARWDATGPVSYVYTYETVCFCPFSGPITVTVENGTVTDVTAPEADLDGADLTEKGLTVEDLFEIAIDAETDADVLDVRYDAEYGYPTVIDIDYVLDAADDEIAYTVTDFEPTG